jgi:probable F420-dependent oxidoreductase
MKPFRFGVQFSSAHDGGGWRAKARMAEELGYSTVFVPDHLDAQWGPLVAMTIAAEATSTLKVGSLMLANDFRNPVVLAKEIATLDLASAGRVEVGIGAGWRERDYRTAGLRFDSAGERIDRLGESVLIMKELWAEAASYRTGRHFSVHVRQGLPVPHSSPHPPVIIGGGGEKMLSLAARAADIVGFSPTMAGGRVGNRVLDSTGPEAFTQRVGWVKAAAGSRWDSLELQVLTIFCRVTEDREASLQAYARASGTTPEALAEAPLALIGNVDQICETVRSRREIWGFSYWVVHEQEMRDFAPVVSRLTGN